METQKRNLNTRMHKFVYWFVNSFGCCGVVIQLFIITFPIDSTFDCCFHCNRLNLCTKMIFSPRLNIHFDCDYNLFVHMNFPWLADIMNASKMNDIIFFAGWRDKYDIFLVASTFFNKMILFQRKIIFELFFEFFDQKLIKRRNSRLDTICNSIQI